MENRTRGRNRRRNRNRQTKGIIVGLSVVLVLAIAVILVLSNKNRIAAESPAKAPETVAEASSEMTREETFPAETQEEMSPAGAEETAAQETPSAETTAEGTTPVGTTTAETTTEETTTEESKPQLLENLDEYKPGDVIDRERFDFDNYKKYFMVYEISPEGNVFKRINGKSYRKNDDIALSDLRYIQMPHYNFNGDIQLGEMIVNKSIAGDVVAIFEELFKNKYQIEKMYLIDNYWTGDGDSSDTNSVDHNNTSAFCYRQSTGGGSLSRHALGLAIDINPQQNPYVSYATGEPKWSHSNANDYIDRSTGRAHMITHDDLAFKLFTSYGFEWGGDWTTPKDYQHFDLR